MIIDNIIDERKREKDLKKKQIKCEEECKKERTTDREWKSKREW